MTAAEQEYLKQIYLATYKMEEAISTNALAALVRTRASSVTDMIKRLAAKNLVVYHPYHGVALSASGKKEALQVMKRFLLWELVLVRTLKMDNKEASEIAVQLQNIALPKLTERLFSFLRHPRYDIRGEVIPRTNES